MQRNYQVAGLLALFLLLLYWPIFHRLDTPPLDFYDESRRAVNAIEMYRGDSHWLVPTYNGAPDRWGTKPPLLVWLQAAGMHLFGPVELAVRLPTGLSALVTVLLLLWFGWRQCGRPLAGALAGLILATTPLYIHNHAARSGDYDTLLTLWLTALALWFYSWIRSGRSRYLWLSALALLLAGWTKGIAAVFFLPGIGLFLLLDPAARRRLTDWRLYAAYGLALIGVLAYYPLRETVDPGFMQQVWDNELGGRYLATNEGHDWPWWFYLRLLLADKWFRPWSWLLLPALLVVWRTPALRRTGGFLGLLLASFLAVISLSATKISWYALPALPLLSLLTGFGLIQLPAMIRRRFSGRYLNRLAWGALVLVGALAYYRIWHKAENWDSSPRIAFRLEYRDFMRRLVDYPSYTLLLPSYNPHAQFYATQRVDKGQEVNVQLVRAAEPIVDPGARADTTFHIGQRVVVCELKPWLVMDRNFHFNTLEHEPPCKLLEVTGQKNPSASPAD